MCVFPFFLNNDLIQTKSVLTFWALEDGSMGSLPYLFLDVSLVRLFLLLDATILVFRQENTKQRIG